MNNLFNTLVETFKTFCMSFICSAPLSIMLYREASTARLFNTVCLVLNAAALLLFIVLYFKNWSWFSRRSFTASEYAVPAAVSFSIYLVVSGGIYVIASNPGLLGLTDFDAATNVIRNIYRYGFQHARFLEPILNNSYDLLSLAIAYTLMVGSLILAPRFSNR